MLSCLIVSLSESLPKMRNLRESLKSESKILLIWKKENVSLDLPP